MFTYVCNVYPCDCCLSKACGCCHFVDRGHYHKEIASGQANRILCGFDFLTGFAQSKYCCWVICYAVIFVFKKSLLTSLGSFSYYALVENVSNL